VTPSPCVIALAGRRIDSAGACPARFPLSQVGATRVKLAHLFVAENAAALVCSAACGADLLALEEAHRLGLRCRIVLPFAAAIFRMTSVTDRPGDWAELYDSLIEESQRAGDLVVLNEAVGEGRAVPDPGDDHAYRAATARIIFEAQAISCPGGDDAERTLQSQLRRVAAVVWEEGAPRGAGDLTEYFCQLARAAGFDERMIITAPA
jgi:hypothetical protein